LAATLIVPLQPVPAQRVAITLTGYDANGNPQSQNCVIQTREICYKQFFSLSISGVPICNNVLMQVNTGLVQAAYAGLYGEFAVIDTSGQNCRPDYKGWGSRWLLLFNPDV
jgi:hypothetical protein